MQRLNEKKMIVLSPTCPYVKIASEVDAMKKKQFPLIPAILLCLLLLTAGGALAGTALIRQQQKEYAMDSLALKEYQSVFLSMYDISTFSEEDFTTYRGIPTLKLDYSFRTMTLLNDALDEIFSSSNELTNLYLGLDPFLMWKSEKEDISVVQSSLDLGLLSYADSHPEITFEILFPFPSMDYWLKQNENDVNSCMILYQQLTNILASRSNITLYFPGAEKWLINNPGNYTGSFSTNELVSQKLFLLTFCDHQLQLAGGNAATLMQQLSDQIEQYRANPVSYPDLSGWDIVFFGDSIIGNYEGSISIPGVVNGLSGASVYNCAQGGISAAHGEGESTCFPQMAEEFLAGAASDPSTTFAKGVAAYQEADHTGKKLCFVIEYGLNDYFGGHATGNGLDAYDITGYAGAMRTGIAALKEKYPDARYIIMGPGQTTYFNNGTDCMSEAGGQLSEYYQLSVGLAEELQALYIDLYNGFPDTGDELEDILADGVHYNEYGRYLTGIRIIDTL